MAVITPEEVAANFDSVRAESADAEAELVLLGPGEDHGAMELATAAGGWLVTRKIDPQTGVENVLLRIVPLDPVTPEMLEKMTLIRLGPTIYNGEDKDRPLNNWGMWRIRLTAQENA